MADKNTDCPKGSEISVKEWLQQIGATNIHFTGGLYHGPPDFVIRYGGEQVAVEVTRLHDVEGWGKDREHAILRKARELYKEAQKEGCSWHGYIEYDPRESKKSMKDRSWQERMRTALRSEYQGEFQLLPSDRIEGEGIILHLLPEGNEGGIAQVSTNCGISLHDTLSERVIDTLEVKAEKMEKSENSHKFCQWWLVLDDEILVVSKNILVSSEIRTIEKRVRKCYSRRRWSKVVLMSRFQSVLPPAKPPKWFWLLWEDGDHPVLPKNPDR